VSGSSEKRKRDQRFMSPKVVLMAAAMPSGGRAFYLSGTSFRYSNHEQEALTGERTS
jgi:hypothetical protein